MKIGMVGYPTVGGSGVVAAELGRQLASRGHEVHFISYDLPFRLTGFHQNLMFHQVEVPSYYLFKYPPYLLALAGKAYEVARFANLDLLHVHYAVPHAPAAILTRDMLGGRLKVVTTLHGTDVTLVGLEPSFQPIIRHSLEVSDGLTAVSRHLAEETESRFAVSRPIAVIPNFVDPEEYHPRFDPDFRARYAAPEEGILIHMSNFRPVKRVDRVVQIFAAVNEGHPSRLLLVGDGPDMALVHRLVDTYGLGDRVHFLCNQARVVDLLQIADCLLLPSDMESFGLAALEAMACGVPVVASRVGGLPEVVRDGVDGYLVPPEDWPAMAERARSIVADGDRRRRMGRAARERAVQDFQSRQVVSAYEQLYRRVLEGGIPPRPEPET